MNPHEPPPHRIPISAERSIATCQKAIYDFHESHHSDQPVVDIYSLPWQNRLTAWHPWYAQSRARRQPQLARTRHSHQTTSLPPLRAEDLDLRVLFFTHPVLAFALWGVLRAFYALDAAVCGWALPPPPFTTEKAIYTNDDGDDDTTLHQWQAMKPLEYLASAGVTRTWRGALEALNGDIRSGRLDGCGLERRIWGIYVGIEGVEERVEGLVGDFARVGVLLGGKGRFEYVLEIVRRVVDERCLMIDEILGEGGGNTMIDEVQENERAVCVIMTA